MKTQKQKLNIYKPTSIIDAVNCLQDFLESDLWSMFNDDEIKGNVYLREDKFKSEKELWNYLQEHFSILRCDIIRLTTQTPHGCEKEMNPYFQGTLETQKLKEQLHNGKKTASKPDNQHPVEKNRK